MNLLNYSNSSEKARNKSGFCSECFGDLTPPISIVYFQTSRNACNYVCAICMQRIDNVTAIMMSFAHLRRSRSKKGANQGANGKS